MTTRRIIRLVACCLALAGLGCEDEIVVQAPPSTAPVAPPAAPAELTELVDPDAGAEEEFAAFTDEDFVELETTHRDPFRPFIAMFTAVSEQAAVSRDVKMGDVPVDAMKVIAIVTRIAPPRAMIQDPTGVGFVVRPRDFIGRPETIQVGSDIPVQLQWQVARVRPNEVVLSRTDPTAPDRPPLTRILPLYNADELEAENLSLR